MVSFLDDIAATGWGRWWLGFGLHVWKMETFMILLRQKIDFISAVVCIIMEAFAVPSLKESVLVLV